MKFGTHGMLALGLAVVWTVAAGAHPPPVPEDTGSASDMLKKKRKTPYESLGASVIEDKQAYQREGYLDIKSVRVTGADPVVVEVETWEALEPEPGGLLVFLVPDGSKQFKYATYLPEPAEDGTAGEWGVFALSGKGVYEDHMGAASYGREGALMTVTVPTEGIDMNKMMVHVHVLSGPDNDNLWKDEAPNERKGLDLP